VVASYTNTRGTNRGSRKKEKEKTNQHNKQKPK
jgi:hypothetical protein